MIDLRCPGLVWRAQKNGRKVAYWVCTSEAAKKSGYPIKTQRIWSGLADQEPTEAERIIIARECHRLRGEAKDWNRDPGLRRRKRAPGIVYFVQSGDLVKIGFTVVLNQRMSALRTDSGQKLTLLGTMSANREIEQFLHWQFRHLCDHGEWFRLDSHLQEFIERNATKSAALERRQNMNSNATRTTRTEKIKVLK